MRIIKFLIILLMTWMTSAATFEDYRSVDVGGDTMNAFKTFGKRLLRRRSANNQEKRDISLSYAATNINNKEGTQVKTITVIKNASDKNQKLKINPELHKNENWAQAFKDNFDSYGIIPDVPDVDDLFEYVNKKHDNVKKENDKKETKADEKKVKEVAAPKSKEKSPIPSTTPAPKQKEKPVTEISAEISEEIKEDLRPVEKIKGDAELLPNFNSSRLKVRESLINLNYSTPKHSVHQYFENYVQLSQGGKEFGGYDYAKPCVHPQPVGSVTVATPSGRTYNIPGNNNSYLNPYLAPTITRRPQVQQQIPPVGGPGFPVNSLLPPLQQQQPNNPNLNNFLQTQQNSNGGGTQQQPQQPNINLQAPNFSTNQQQPQQNQNSNSQGQNNLFTTSQRPYVAPNIRSGLAGVSRGPTAGSNLNGYQNGQPGYRINTFNTGFRKPNLFRSRGLKY